jgi:hypothetical protein
MNIDEMKQYQIEPKAWWLAAQMIGMDGYDTLETAERRGWHAIPAWGSRGWDLGSWPLVVIYHRNQADSYSVAEYVEGDVTVYTCPTKELREQITDALAFFHWHIREESWVKGYETVDQLPTEFRGPY